MFLPKLTNKKVTARKLQKNFNFFLWAGVWAVYSWNITIFSTLYRISIGGLISYNFSLTYAYEKMPSFSVKLKKLKSG